MINQQTEVDQYYLHLHTFRKQSTAIRVANALGDQPAAGIAISPDDIYVNGCGVFWRRGGCKPMPDRHVAIAFCVGYANGVGDRDK